MSGLWIGLSAIALSATSISITDGSIQLANLWITIVLMAINIWIFQNKANKE